MTDPIEIDRDDGSRLALSRAEVVRAMAAMRLADFVEAVRAETAGRKRATRYGREPARERGRDG